MRSQEPEKSNKIQWGKGANFSGSQDWGGGGGKWMGLRAYVAPNT